MGFTIEVGRDPDTVNDANAFSTGQDASHYLYIISKTLPAAIGVSLTDMEALVKMEVTNTRYKFATFSISGASWSIDNIESSWHNAGSTAKQLISVSSGSLGISTGNYVGIVFEVPANTSQNTFIYYEASGSSLTNYYQISNTYITSGTATSTSQPPLDIYGYGEYNHSNTDTIPQTSQSTGALSVDELYTGYGAIRLTDIDCVGTYSALFEMQSPWGETDNTVILESGQSETMSRGITGGTEYYKVTVTNINCVSNTVTFTEQWWSDDGNRYVKTGGSDSAMGTTWDAAWKTNGYGFQNIPSGKDLYVEEGYYGDETLSNLNPPQTMKMYIQPSGHTEAACEVHVFEHSVLVSTVNEDSWTKSTDPDSNFNGDSYLRIGVPSGQTRYSHLQFDISSLPSSPTLYSAIMRIYVVYESNRAIELRKESSTFDETSITWNNKPASTNSTITQVITETGWIDLDITAILTAAFGDSTLGIEIRPTSSSGFSFGRHESGYGASLIIQYD